MDIENVVEIDVEPSAETSNKILVETEKTGPAGLSAYQVAVKNGFVGTEQEWLESLVGEKGDRGETGATGQTGLPGRDGAIQYTAGDNITIENNVISATGGDLSNYYTKVEVDGKIIPVLNLELDMQNGNISSKTYYANNSSQSRYTDIVNDFLKLGYNYFYVNLIFQNNSSYGGRSFLVRPSWKPTDDFLSATGRMVMFSDTLMQPKSSYAPFTLQFTLNLIFDSNNEHQISWFWINPITMEQYISKTNTVAYTPTSNYNPATKKYVDDKIASAITDALGGNY